MHDTWSSRSGIVFRGVNGGREGGGGGGRGNRKGEGTEVECRTLRRLTRASASL